MKRIIILSISLLCIISLFSSCGHKHLYYTAETELGDTFTLEVYLSGNMHGVYPNYIIYDGDENIGKENGTVVYVVKDRAQEGHLPENPVSSITTVGTYGNHNFYKIFDMLFYYQKGVYIDSIPDTFDLEYYERYKMDQGCPAFIVYRAQAVSDLMKSHIFDYIFKYGEIPASDKDPEMEELMLRYASGNFSDEEKQINADSKITEADMTSFAQYVLAKYYTE